MRAIQTSLSGPSRASCPCPCGRACAASYLSSTAQKGRESGPQPHVAPLVVAVRLHPPHRARGRAQEVHQNRHDRIQGPRRYYERGNEEQQEDDGVSHLRRTADEIPGDGKLGLKRLDDQWLQTSWRDHGSEYVSPIAGRP